MKKYAIWVWAVCLVPLLAQAEYYRPFEGGYARYKLEAVRQLVTPQMHATAEALSTDRNVQEVVEMALALDGFVYDGMRLVRTRGLLVTTGEVSEDAIGRTVIYYGVTREEAKAWLLASRAMQVTGYKTGESLPVLEFDMVATADDLQRRLETYFPEEVVWKLMPNFIWTKSCNLAALGSSWTPLPGVKVPQAKPVETAAPVPAPAKKHSLNIFSVFGRH